MHERPSVTPAAAAHSHTCYPEGLAAATAAELPGEPQVEAELRPLLDPPGLQRLPWQPPDVLETTGDFHPSVVEKY